MKSPVRVQFWGTRGSIARPGQKTLRYGGNTSCLQVTSPGGALVVIDCGTGAFDLGQSLVAAAVEPLRGSLLISHTHWDHVQGFPFFAPLFARGGHWDIYGPSGLGQSLRETLAGQMQYTYFPVTLDQLEANIHYHDLVEGNFEIDDIRITTRYLNHPVLTLGYRLEMGGTSLVYACDHEPYARAPDQRTLHERDRHHSEFFSQADLLIHDAQFTDAEYSERKGWGHSPVEYASEMAQWAGVRQIALTHHDPLRTDDALDEIVAGVQADLAARKSGLQAFAAADGQVVELAASRTRPATRSNETAPEASAAAPALRDSTVILGIADTRLALILAEASNMEGVRVSHAADGNQALQMAVVATPPVLVIVEDDFPGLDGLSVCRKLRAKDNERLKQVPVVIVADKEKTEDGKRAGVTGWLIKPFSKQYARARIQAWLMRSACRWAAAALPPDESARLAALRELAVLDTPPEERFDRITRVAAALADVPIALVSLVDQDRQWFKSCYGLEVAEMSREVAFCAHVVFSGQPMIVPDTLQDDRFADNPLVTGGPRIRFYGGFPVFHHNGSCLGTLCLIDVRPRQFPETTLQLLADLTSLVQQELNSRSAHART
ncbi:MAG: GAF domain-containing protein [Nitrospirota bacterium]